MAVAQTINDPDEMEFVVLAPPQELSEIRTRIRTAGIPLVGESEPFVRLLRASERIARHGTAAVLIHGETGTGKELIARTIHYLSARRDYPFVPVNCGALPEALAENELFGHRAGAFTHAAREAVGLVRLSHEGTLFLDEVDSLPPKVQVALLRFLQDGRFRPLGAGREEQANVRIIAASNRPLKDAVEEGSFRADLFYRLNVLSIEIPPLRARCGDAQLLAEHFLREFAVRHSVPCKSLDAATLAWFGRYTWPGNVRELENMLQREFLLGDGAELRIAPPRVHSVAAPPAGEGAQNESYRAAKSRALEEFDRDYLQRILRESGGNVSKAARLAGKERRAFGKLLKRYRIGRRRSDDETHPSA
ncbi:MAG TPA: sigma-54 dependent transcriptional regulator [Steroidobacteraceae bacterium]|nr:sigma-54 dependent transcriptional regulator [Steroidobacteraceae bacterium]